MPAQRKPRKRARPSSRRQKENSEQAKIRSQTLAEETQASSYLDPEPSAFLRLPPEIRNRIYEYVFGVETEPSSDFVIPWRLDQCPHDDYPPEDKSCLNLLLSCRKLCLEAFHVFYQVNAFSFEDTSLLYEFLRSIGPVRRNEIKSIRFVYGGSFAKEAFRLLKTCSKLQRVDVVLKNCSKGGFAALGEVRGLQRLSIEPLPEWKTWIWTPEMEAMAEELKTAMMRPRPSGYASRARELDLFKARRPRKTECETLGNHNIANPRYRLRYSQKTV